MLSSISINAIETIRGTQRGIATTIAVSMGVRVAGVPLARRVSMDNSQVAGTRLQVLLFELT